MNIAVIVAGGLSEALQSAPLLGRLAGSDNGRLLLAGPPEVSDLARGLAGVDEILPLDALGAGAPVSGLAAAVVALRHRRVDTALICSDRARERVLAYASGCSRRVGASSGPLGALLTSGVPGGAEENRGLVWLRLAAAVGAGGDQPRPAVDPDRAARDRAEALLVGGGFEDGRLLLAVAPGAGFGRGAEGYDAGELCWQPERYAHLANQLARRHGMGIVICGGEEDRWLVERMLLDLEADRLDLVGQLSVVEAAAVAQRCDLAASGDTPFLHLAAGVGTPAIGIFGPTDGRRRGPFGPEHRVVQAVAGDWPLGALDQVRVDDVLAGIEARL